MWTLTYSVSGRRHVEYLPKGVLALVTGCAEQGTAYNAALKEILTINAQLLTLWRLEQLQLKKKRKKQGGGTDRRSGT